MFICCCSLNLRTLKEQSSSFNNVLVCFLIHRFVISDNYFFVHIYISGAVLGLKHPNLSI